MFNKMITRLLPVMPKKLVWIFSKKYIAGETLDDAIRVCRELNAMKIRFTLDLLGEFITRLDEATANKEAYLAIIDHVESEKRRDFGDRAVRLESWGDRPDTIELYRQMGFQPLVHGTSYRLDL